MSRDPDTRPYSSHTAPHSRPVWSRASDCLLVGFRPAPIDFLVYFRLVFAAIMLLYVVMYLHYDYVGFYYVQPKFLFKWFGFSWVTPWSGQGMYDHYYVMAGLAVLMAVGLFYRLAAFGFALCFTYVFLLDRAQYQNHYYLIMLMSWVMAIVPANRAWCLDVRMWPALRSATAPLWSRWLLRFMVGVPYFFGGVAKISPDWLAGQPMRMSLAGKTWYPVIGPYFSEEWMVQSFVWGGLLLDLLIVPALLWKPTRVAAFLCGLTFHIMNATMFNIGVFPWFMIFATVVFFEPGWVSRLVGGRRLRRKQHCRLQKTESSLPTWNPKRRLLVAGLSAFVLIQVALPFRHHLYPGDVNWTEEGHYFSWHMKLRSKECALRVEVRDPVTGEVSGVLIPEYLTLRQAMAFKHNPLMLVQFSHFLKDELARRGKPDQQVRIVNIASLNGRKPQYLVDPNIDLSQISTGWSYPREIIVPLTEPLRHNAWDRPVSEWERFVSGSQAESRRLTNAGAHSSSGQPSSSAAAAQLPIPYLLRRRVLSVPDPNAASTTQRHSTALQRAADTAEVPAT